MTNLKEILNQRNKWGVFLCRGQNLNLYKKKGVRSSIDKSYTNLMLSTQMNRFAKIGEVAQALRMSLQTLRFARRRINTKDILEIITVVSRIIAHAVIKIKNLLKLRKC